MHKLTRTAVGVLTAAAVIVPLSVAGPAEAAPGRDWTNVDTFNRAKHQACKVSTAEGTAWRIFNRLDARLMARDRVRATLTAHGANGATRGWASGWVRNGTVSDVGAFNVPKQGWALSRSIGTDNAGDGSDLLLSDIGRC